MDSRVFSLPRDLILAHDTRDPFRLAQRLGYYVHYINTKKQKGFCTNILNNYFIYINENMSRQMQRMTCAHELGHILLHKDRLRTRGFRSMLTDTCILTACGCPVPSRDMGAQRNYWMPVLRTVKKKGRRGCVFWRQQRRSRSLLILSS